MQRFRNLKVSVAFASLALVGGMLCGCGKDSALKSYMNGIEAFKQGHYAVARKNLERALRDRPDQAEDAPAYNYLGLAAERSGDVAAAKAAFEKSHALDENYYEACYNLGALRCREGDMENGPRLLMRAAGLNKKDARPLELLAHHYQENGQVNEARSMLQVARQRAPNSARIFTRMAANGLPHEGSGYAASYLKEALENDPDYATALYNRAALHDRWINDREGALADYRRYMNLAPNGEKAGEAESAIARLEQAVAQDFAEASRPKDSPVVYPLEADSPPVIPLKATPVRPNAPSPDLPPGSVADLLVRAEAEANAGRQEQALNLCLQAAALASRNKSIADEEKSLRTAVALCADQPRAHFALGRYLNERGDFRQAMRAFQRAGEIEPQWESAHLSTAAAAIECSEFQAALVALRNAVKAAPDKPDPLWALALFYDTQLKLESSAHRSFTRFVSKFPDDHRVTEAKARLKNLSPEVPTSPVSVRMVDPVPAIPAKPKLSHEVVTVDSSEGVNNRPAEKVTTFRSDKVLTPKRVSPQEYRTRAEAHFAQGSRFQAQQDVDRAALYYTQAINEDATFAPPFYNLGIIYQGKNQLERARNAYTRALENDPSLINAKYNLALIQAELGDPIGAKQQFEAILREAPDYAAAHLMLARALGEEAAQFEAARKHFTRFLELAPDDPNAPEARRWLLRH